MYGNAEDVIFTSGALPEHFGLNTEPELVSLVEVQLETASDIINAYKRRNYDQEVTDGVLAAVPDLAHDVAEAIVANKLNVLLARRTSPIVRINDFVVRLTDDTTLSKEVVRLLDLLPGPNLATSSHGFGMARVPGRFEPTVGEEEV